VTDRPGEVSPDAMRAVLGHFLSGVTVVTSLAGDEPLGFTCQSFSSLSLDPPLIAIFPARSSSTWPRIRDTGRFCVNVLAQGQAELSARFAAPGDRFADVAWSRSPFGSPLLGGVVAWIDCTLWREYDGGDHTIVAGHVEHLGAVSEIAPLAFHRGQYAELP
jgi:3-hydroxy-9,10-secoandrosta-1,3,5(10)-triene-9,17-dione monooxygenase reductase component